tara:strand:+ start:3360 stop:4124 length:765 start_codon:yes stop_codon:yes gene_type:complete
MNIETRSGNFTNSQIYKIAAKPSRGNKDFLASGETYIKERWLERLLLDKLQEDGYSRAKAWGKFMEAYLFCNKLGTEYKISSQSSIRHPDEFLGLYWAGTTDFEVGGKEPMISEAKCYYKKNFALYSMAIIHARETDNPSYLKENHPEEYWQIVGNTILNGVDYGEAICFMPTYDDLEEIREYAEDPMWIEANKLGPMWHYRFLYEEPKENLQLLNPKSKIPSINKYRFLVPVEDKEYLTSRVELSIDKLEELL